MSHIFKLTATRSQWGGAIQAGETFTLVENSSSPNSNTLLKIIKEQGRYKGTSSSLPSMNLDDTYKETNGWIVEKIK